MEEEKNWKIDLEEYKPEGLRDHLCLLGREGERRRCCSEHSFENRTEPGCLT